MARIFGKYVLCNMDPFITLMGNYNWGPISRNNIVSRYNLADHKKVEIRHLNHQVGDTSLLHKGKFYAQTDSERFSNSDKGMCWMSL